MTIEQPDPATDGNRVMPGRPPTEFASQAFLEKVRARATAHEKPLPPPADGAGPGAHSTSVPGRADYPPEQAHWHSS